jgi:hypothetical protein
MVIVHLLPPAGGIRANQSLTIGCFCIINVRIGYTFLNDMDGIDFMVISVPDPFGKDGSHDNVG